jgi:hypothetical protein
MTETEKIPRAAIYTVRDFSALFHVSTRTVRRWVSDGLLKPRGYRRRGGIALEMIFTGPEVENFLDNYLLAPEDLDSGKARKTSEERAAELRRILGTLRVFAGKATAARIARRCEGKIK